MSNNIERMSNKKLYVFIRENRKFFVSIFKKIRVRFSILFLTCLSKSSFFVQINEKICCCEKKNLLHIMLTDKVTIKVFYRRFFIATFR